MPEKVTVLIAHEDDLVGLEEFFEFLKDDYTLLSTNSIGKAQEILKGNPTIEMVIANFSIQESSGIAILQEFQKTYPHIKRILLSTDLNEASNSYAVESGIAHRVITHPWAKREFHKTMVDLSETLFFGVDFEKFKMKLDRFKKVIQEKKLTPYFQPIVLFEPFYILGYEIFTRGPEDTFFE